MISAGKPLTVLMTPPFHVPQQMVSNRYKYEMIIMVLIAEMRSTDYPWYFSDVYMDVSVDISATTRSNFAQLCTRVPSIMKSMPLHASDLANHALLVMPLWP